MKKIISKPQTFILAVLALTWIIQLLPIILKMDVNNTSISSFDYSSIFLILGGMIPSLLGVVFVFLLIVGRR